MIKTEVLDLAELSRMGFIETSDGYVKSYDNELSLTVNASTGRGMLQVGIATAPMAVLNISHLKWFLEALVGGVYFKKHAWRTK